MTSSYAHLGTCERFALSVTSILMIVCVCNAIREEDLRREARKGATSPGRGYAQLGCKAKCGSCLPFAREIIDAELAALEEATSAAA